jgi:BA14K-like protein/outer membrane protein with glycine zipper
LPAGAVCHHRQPNFQQEVRMKRAIGAAALLTLALAMPVQDAAAQDVLGGALLGGAAGAILGGAVGGGRGAAVGAIIGAGTGAIIASEGQRRANGYYYYNNGCYIQQPDGSWVAVAPNYCGPGPAYAPPPPAPAPAYVAGDAAAYCAQRYRSYDPVSRTFMGFDGIRRPCP